MITYLEAFEVEFAIMHVYVVLLDVVLSIGSL